MDTDEGKLFLGGIAWETSEDKLRGHFGTYGEVKQAVIMRDKITGKPRGFGFVALADNSLLDLVLQDTHIIDGRTVEVKRALSREEQRSRPANPSGRSSNVGNFRTKKIFVGGLPSTLTEEEFRQYFETYGNVTDVVIMYDQNTRRPRGFGFITFDNEDSVDRVLEKNFHDLDNKQVEVKAALPKEANPGGGHGGGGYQPYGSGANAASFDAQMNGNRFMPPQAAVGAYSPYPGYGGASYGYRAGFPGPGGPYGIPAIPNAGYMGGPPGALKSQWNGQIPGYGAGTGYGAPFSGMVPAPGGASVYGYGGSYGGNDGSSYSNSGSHGAVDGGRFGGGVASSNSGSGTTSREQQPGSGGYAAGSGGYGNNNGSSGYAGGAW